MGDKSIGRIVTEAFAQAIPWAIVFTAAAAFTAQVVMNMARQEVKEAIEFTATTAVRETVQLVLNDPVIGEHLWPLVKQNVKEAIEYTATVAAQQMASAQTAQGPKKK
ncbi:hypothetical protein [Nitrospira sp. Kam-Ns4a]